jgi:hypothetical protein
MQKSVFQAIDHESNPIRLTPQFQRALQASKDPHIILFMGCTRAGKSTRLNQIITREHKLDLTGPFVARGGSKAVTVGFQFCGPISFDELNHIHNLGLTIDETRNPDIFLIDCEGMDHLDGSCPGFGKSMFALSQLSSVNVIVMRGPMNRNDVLPLTTLFRMNKFLQNADRQIETGFAIIEREVGISVSHGDPPLDGSAEF